MFWYGRTHNSDFEWVRVSIVDSVASECDKVRTVREAARVVESGRYSRVCEAHDFMETMDKVSDSRG